MKLKCSTQFSHPYIEMSDLKLKLPPGSSKGPNLSLGEISWESAAIQEERNSQVMPDTPLLPPTEPPTWRNFWNIERLYTKPKLRKYVKILMVAWLIKSVFVLTIFAFLTYAIEAVTTVDTLRGVYPIT